jgi:hypothetical protein
VLHHACFEELGNVLGVLDDLRQLTGRRYGKQRFANRIRTLLLQHWAAVEALALALIKTHHIEGDQVECIIVGSGTCIALGETRY